MSCAGRQLKTLDDIIRPKAGKVEGEKEYEWPAEGRDQKKER